MSRRAAAPVLTVGDVLYETPGFSLRKHMAGAKRSPLWRRVRVYITVRHLERLDALRTPYMDRAYALSDALDYAFKGLDKILARRAKRAAKEGGAR